MISSRGLAVLVLSAASLMAHDAFPSARAGEPSAQHRASLQRTIEIRRERRRVKLERQRAFRHWQLAQEGKRRDKEKELEEKREK
jgi:hypothetical protein